MRRSNVIPCDLETNYIHVNNFKQRSVQKRLPQKTETTHLLVLSEWNHAELEPFSAHRKWGLKLEWNPSWAAAREALTRGRIVFLPKDLRVLWVWGSVSIHSTEVQVSPVTLALTSDLRVEREITLSPQESITEMCWRCGRPFTFPSF